VRPGRLPQRQPQPGTASARSGHLGWQPDRRPRPTRRRGRRPRLHHGSGRLAERVQQGVPRPLVGRRHTTLPDPAAYCPMGVRSAQPPARPALPRGGELPERGAARRPPRATAFCVDPAGAPRAGGGDGPGSPGRIRGLHFPPGRPGAHHEDFPRFDSPRRTPWSLCSVDKCAVYSKDTATAASVATALPPAFLLRASPLALQPSKRPVQLLAPTTPATSWTGCKPCPWQTKTGDCCSTAASSAVWHTCRGAASGSR
jgi:hypothetical protein